MKKKVYLNADVVTMDDASPSARAFGVFGDRFAIVGSDEEVTQWGGDEADRTDLAGQTVLPGLIETHNHLSFYSFRMDHVDCSDQHFLVSHTSGHLAYVNSKLLAKMGIDDTTPNPEGGEIDRDASGRVTGLLKETALFPLLGMVPKPSSDEIKSLLQRGIAVANQNGVTSIHDAAIGMEGCGPDVVRGYQALASENKLGVRAYLTLMHTLYDHYQQLGIGTGFGDENVKIGSIKLLQDGSIQGYTGWLSQPYYDRQDSGHVSQPIMSQSALDALVEKYHRAGLQIAIHGNGDAAIESIISAVEKAQKKHYRKDPRHLLIHCQTVREDQIPRMKPCGLMPSYFVQHVYYWGDRHHDIFLGRSVPPE